ncbi:MAG TPA: hypothetical protein VGK88_02185 [bacterium]
MTAKTLEKKLKPLSMPLDEGLLRWLYLHLPPQPIKTKKMHRSYSEAIRILMREREVGTLDAADDEATGKYLSAVIPFVEQYEKAEFPIGSVTPEAVLRFLHGRTSPEPVRPYGGSGRSADSLGHSEREAKAFA